MRSSCGPGVSTYEESNRCHVSENLCVYYCLSWVSVIIGAFVGKSKRRACTSIVSNIELCLLFHFRGESLHQKERELQLAQARASESSGALEPSLASQLQLKVDSLEAENARLRDLDGPRAGEPMVYSTIYCHYILWLFSLTHNAFDFIRDV